MLNSLRIQFGNRGFLLLALTLILFFSCSSSKNEARETSQSSEMYRRWIHERPIDIPIPEATGEQAELTRNFYFIIDGSGSMRETTDRHCGGDQSFSNKISGARWAIKKFLEQVPGDVNLGLYVFDREGQREVIPLGKANREAFLTAVDNINASGGTPLADAIKFGTDKLVESYQKQLGYGEFRLVVVTDGIANRIPQAALYAARYGIPIYAIGLCVEPDHPLRYFSVSYRAADNFQDLSQGLADTLAELQDFDVTEFPGATEEK